VARRFGGKAGGITDWAAIVQLYDALLAMTGSPVVAINRAVALAAHLGGAQGARAALVELDALESDARLAEYQPYWAARADLLSRAGEQEAAQAAYRRAIGLEPDAAVRRFLQRRLGACEARV
jgi:RNA polymerase sigma-70 factor (ECF subfamily)